VINRNKKKQPIIESKLQEESSPIPINKIKKQTIKTPSNSFLLIIILVSCLVFNNSCKKEISTVANPKKSALTNTVSNSSIIYTNANPDSTVVCISNTGIIINKNYNLDLNNDGITDFVFYIHFQRFNRATTGYENYVSVSGLTGSGNEVENVNGYPSALDTLAVIDGSDSKWPSVSKETLSEYYHTCTEGRCWGGYSGNWTSGTVKYLGLKFIKGGNTYYGWATVVVFVSIGSKLTVMDYAYNSSPNQPILAGQTK
jgi:hypothetical protein